MAASRILFASLARKYSSNPKVALNAAQSGHGPEAIKLWKNISYFVAFPAIIVCAINTYLKHKEHEAHPRPEFIPYEHLRIRTKRFPWGDGTRSFFHNPHVNPLPDGYEDEH